MQVLLATTGYPPEHSGSGGRLHDMYRRLADRPDGPRWSVLTKRRAPGLTPPRGPQHVTVLGGIEGGDTQSGYRAAPQEIAALRRLVRAGLLDGIDLVHVAGSSWYTPFLIGAARRRGLPVVRELTSVGDVTTQRSPAGWLVRRSLRRASHLVAISPALESAARAAGARTPVWCRPNGADLTRFRAPDATTRSASRETIAHWLPGLKADETVILHVGRIRPLKNQLFLADTAACLPAGYRLLMIGPAYSESDPYLVRLRARLAEPDLAARAALVAEHRSDIDFLMAGADMFAFPSRNEGLGNVMVEAACSGLPVVAHRLPGVTDWIVTDGETGALAPLEVDAFVRAVERAAPLVARRAALAERAAGWLGADAMDDGYVGLFTRLTAQRR